MSERGVFEPRRLGGRGSLRQQIRALLGLRVEGVEQERLPRWALPAMLVGLLVGSLAAGLVTDSPALRALGGLAGVWVVILVANRRPSSQQRSSGAGERRDG